VVTEALDSRKNAESCINPTEKIFFDIDKGVCIKPNPNPLLLLQACNIVKLFCGFKKK